MEIIGVVFDFNGTMLFDRKYHLDSWQRCIEDLIMHDITEEDVLRYVDGKGSKEILEHFLGYELTDPMINQFQEEKERIYRNQLVKDHPPLAPGLEEYLDYLKGAGVPVAIATSAPIPNVNLYFDEYELFRWFDWDHIIMVADDCPAKPHPALFQHAIKQIQVAPEHTVVFEDSAVGMEAAYRAGVRHIIHITGDSPAAEKEKEMPGVIRKISDYTELKMDEMND